jgi:hypothetical protein
VHLHAGLRLVRDEERVGGREAHQLLKYTG